MKVVVRDSRLAYETTDPCLALDVTEQSKSLETVQQIWDWFFELGLTRRDEVVAVGGGALTDMVGFACATYKRGVPYVNVPTTLLAMVDASTGGKTGINYRGLKNSIGVFYPPKETIIDTKWLETLPVKEMLSGFGELLKTGLLDAALWPDVLQYDLETMPLDDLKPLITRCVDVKERFVHADPHEEGLRKVLNLGHTFGHAVETCSGYTILHGQAVAMGMAAVTKAASEMGLCSKETSVRVLELLDRYELLRDIPFGLQEMYEAMLVDKKNNGSVTNLIVPVAIGNCRIMKIPTEKLKGWLAEGGVED